MKMKDSSRKEKRHMIKSREILICLLFCAALALICGCGKGGIEEGETQMEKREGMTLAGVKYETYVGMVYGSNLSMEIEPQRIVSARYFSEEDNDYVQIADVPIDSAQWSKIEAAVMEIVPVLEEITEKKTNFFGNLFSKEILQPTDGPDYSNFFLTWENEKGEKELVQYYNPNDRRFSTVISLMEETVNPIGREIIYYDVPVH